jgi:hypothetical protein
MAISGTVIWEVRGSATASNANGGGFRPGASGVDYSQQDSAQYNLTGCTSSAANAIILNANAAADMVGNIAHVISGTNATAGWYEIISVVAGVSITVDRNWGTGAVSNGVVNIGGALVSFDTWTSAANTFVAGQTVYVKAGTSISNTGNISATGGNAGAPVTYIGYNSTRSDSPTGSNRPIVNTGTGTGMNFGAWTRIYNIIFTSTSTRSLSLGGGNNIVRNCKAINTSTTANRAAIDASTGPSEIVNCEAVSYRGNAISISGSDTVLVYGCYIHDSNNGINNSVARGRILFNLIVGNVTNAILNGSSAHDAFISNNTLWGGADNKTGTGISLGSSANAQILNNIIYGFVTGIVDTTGIAGANYANYNDLFNNTTNYSGISGDSGSVTTDPSFTSVTQITGTTATTSGNVLTQIGADFSVVVDNVDYCYIVSGTGVTVGQYLITSHTTTTLTLDIAPGTNATANKVFQVLTGRNFGVGTNMKALAFPGTFQEGLTVGYLDIGAVQRQETSGSGNTYSRGRVVNQ